MRINKYLAMCNLGSRRSVEELVLNGEIYVNGEKCLDLATDIELGKDVVTLEGETLKVSEKKIYIAMNKPRGYIVTKSDELNRKTVFDLLPDFGVHVFAVGRLDMDSEGLLLITNDGEFANKVMHPSYKLSKIYKVDIKGRISNNQLKALQEGVEIDGEMTLPARVFVKKSNDEMTTLRMTIFEGKNRQIRRMIDAVGLEVLNLRRLQVGGVKLNDLPTGLYRPLRKFEVEAIYSETGEVKVDEDEERQLRTKYTKKAEPRSKGFGDRKRYGGERPSRERSFERRSPSRFNSDRGRTYRHSRDEFERSDDVREEGRDNRSSYSSRDNRRFGERSYSHDSRDNRGARDNRDSRGFRDSRRDSRDDRESRGSRDDRNRRDGTPSFRDRSGRDNRFSRGADSDRRDDGNRRDRYSRPGERRDSFSGDRPRSNYRGQSSESRGGERDNFRRDGDRPNYRKSFEPRSNRDGGRGSRDQGERRFDRDRAPRSDSRDRAPRGERRDYNQGRSGGWDRSKTNRDR
ncbi:MAG: pseudouridine synthase [Candidatus Cloacimonas sp.]|nr:pseudouridine synthase [Candidatus Cloacimonadota bacterium]